ncbi:MAG TPA: hypothetical protein VE972_14085 [Conexibacter sp.]|nr:hypothetical protein [Conexibacter sp.]
MDRLAAGRSNAAVHRLAVASSVGLVMLLLVLAFAVPANALTNFTGEDEYGCSVTAGTWCWYQGTELGTTNSANAINHSYGFQSAKYSGGGEITVFTAICYSTCAVASGTNFRRLCWPNWKTGSEELECDDQDGVSGVVRIKGGASATITGHALW